MKRPNSLDDIYWDFDGNYREPLFIDDLEQYIDYLEKELDFYWRGGAQILDKDKDE